MLESRTLNDDDETYVCRSGYILFVNEKVESGMLDFTAIGHMWSKLSKDEQERYKRKSEKVIKTLKTYI